VEQPAGSLLAQDKQDDFSKKAAEELQAQGAADEEGSHYVSTHCPTCQQLQVQLMEATNENTPLAEENARLCWQMGLAERAPKVSGRGARFCHLEKKHKETKSAFQGRGGRPAGLSGTAGNIQPYHFQATPGHLGSRQGVHPPGDYEKTAGRASRIHSSVKL